MSDSGFTEYSKDGVKEYPETVGLGGVKLKSQTVYFDSVKAKEIEVDGEVKTVYPFVLTSEIVDRDGDVVVVNDMNIDNYKKNAQVFFEHDTRKHSVGKAYNVKKLKGKIVGDVWFHELDEESKQIKRYVEAGVYEAGSIGFRVYGSRKRRASVNEKTPFETINELTPTELYEFSVVKIPANPEAIRKAYEREVEAKQKGLLKENDNIMEEIKAGAVLNQKNRQNLIEAKEKIEKVLASAENEKNEEVQEQIEEIKRYTLAEWNKLNTKRITIDEYNQLLNKEGRNAR